MSTALILVSLLALVEFLVLVWLCRRIAPLLDTIKVYRESMDKQIARTMERIERAEEMIQRARGRV